MLAWFISNGWIAGENGSPKANSERLADTLKNCSADILRNCFADTLENCSQVIEKRGAEFLFLAGTM